ncbi:MAG: type II toxin-antitoxin system RelE/ParE family toxin [Oleiphilus sp.]|nr:MAG: type II toxin-antitoxin system RelE/ParE family toxin [Oleiphilus sp.]
MKLTFTVTAIRDLLRLREFIENKNPQAAMKASALLKQNIQSLVQQPKLGIPIEGLDEYRELVAREYIVRYRVLKKEIVILKIWHGREDR